MKQTRQDFFTANGEGIKIMTFTEFARHILRMECGESLELYAVVNRQTRECSRPLSVRKEQWNGTPFYLLGGHGQEVRTINFAGRPKEEFETTCHDVLDSYDAVESIGAVVSRLRELSPEELHKRIAEEMKTGCKYLLVYRSEEEMTAALDGKIYAISDTDGKFLCDLYQPDYLHLETGRYCGHRIHSGHAFPFRLGNRQPHGTRQGALLPDGDYIYPRNGNAMIEIGNRIETPEGVFYELEYGGEGNIYKNEDAFLNRPDEVCYVPEYAAEDREDWRVSESSDGCFTHNSLLALCKGNEEVCQDLFYSLEWTYPTTLLEEWDSNGYFDEIEGWYDSND